MDELLLMEGGKDAQASHGLLYMHEEVKNQQVYRMNYSMSQSSDLPLASVITSSDLIEDGVGEDTVFERLN